MFTYTQEKQISKEQGSRIAQLQEEIKALQNELGNENADAIIEKHIALLHEYNEAKDATQILLGRLAVLKETTVRQLHEDYGLTTTD